MRSLLVPLLVPCILLYFPAPVYGAGISGTDRTIDGGLVPWAIGANRGLPLAQEAPVEAPPSEPPGTRKGLMIAGWSTLVGGYLTTALVGLTMLEEAEQIAQDPTRYCANCESVGTMMLIPVLGPFLAIPDADGTDGMLVAALLGLVQVAGLGMAIPGTIMFRRDREASMAWERDHRQGSRWFITPTVGGQGNRTPMVLGGFQF